MLRLRPSSAGAAMVCSGTSDVCDVTTQSKGTIGMKMRQQAHHFKPYANFETGNLPESSGGPCCAMSPSQQVHRLLKDVKFVMGQLNPNIQWA